MVEQAVRLRIASPESGATTAPAAASPLNIVIEGQKLLPGDVRVPAPPVGIGVPAEHAVQTARAMGWQEKSGRARLFEGVSIVWGSLDLSGMDSKVRLAYALQATPLLRFRPHSMHG